MTDEPEDIWWRVEIREQVYWDDDYEVVTSRSYYPVWSKYRVIKTTPKGVWVRSPSGLKSFVLGTATKQLCVPTRELAIDDEFARRERHVKGCEARLYRAKQALDCAQWEAAKTHKESA